MSVIVPEVKIDIISLGVRDGTANVTKIKKQIHLAIIRGIKRCLRAAIDLAFIIVPEAIEREPPYPASYFDDQTEEMMETYITFLKQQIRKAFALTRKLHDVYTIDQEWEASYSQFVNEMVGVNWSKPGSHGGFIEELDNFIRTNLQVFVHAELQRRDLGQVLLYRVT